MKRSNLLIGLGVLILTILLVTICFLSMGRCTEIVILDSNSNQTTYKICKGELVAEAGGVDADRDTSTEELLKKTNSLGAGRTYFENNVFNKGYNNDQVVSMVKNYLEPQGMKVTVKNAEIVFVGFNWMVHKFSK